MTSELSTFAARVRAFIAASVRVTDIESGIITSSELGTRNSELKAALPQVGCFDGAFQSLALELFALQFTHNFAYRKFCAARRVTPLTMAHWSQIPAVPTAAFKEIELTSLAPEQRTHVFHSSGTTEQRPSRHFHCAESLAVYEASLWAWFEPHVVPEFRVPSSEFQVAVLTPPPVQSPKSSLVHMFECVRRKLGADPSAFCGLLAADGAWTLDLNQTLARLKSTETSGSPLLLLGTAFSFVHLLDGLAELSVRVSLPPGSRVLETGGYKGRSRALPKAELHELITERLGVPSSQIICEYGMSELSSQAYDNEPERRSPTRRVGARQPDHAGSETGAPSPSRTRLRSAPARQVTHHGSRSFRFPPWTRVQIISPETGGEVAEGETGLIRVFDLANVCSVMAIQTEDLAVRRGNGFELLGRAALSEPRGCSLMAV